MTGQNKTGQNKTGQNNLSFPPMGCGTWAWGNRLLWGYDKRMDPELHRVFDRCVASGVTLFDTGDSYGTGTLKGRSELLLGEFERAYQGPNKDQICLATKLAPYPWRWSKGSIAAAFQASAQRLGRVDLVQLHWSTANYAPWQEGALLDGLADLYDQGLVGGVGLSNFGTRQLRKIYPRFQQRGVPVRSLQVQYSLLSTYAVTELGVKDLCDELGIQLIAYSPLCLGLLTGRYSTDGPKPTGLLRKRLFQQLLPGARSLLATLQVIGEAHQKTMAQTALNWCMGKGTIPIPGAKDLCQAEQNIGALGWQLSNGEILELDKASASLDRKMVQNIFQTR